MYLINEWLLERDDEAARIGLIAGEHTSTPAAVKTMSSVPYEPSVSRTDAHVP